MSRGAKVGLALVLVVGLGMSGIVCVRVAERGRHAVDHSTLGAGPKGARALYLLAEELGGSPRRLTEDVARLPDGAMLVVMGGCRPGRKPAPRERQVIRRWVEDGGVLLVAGARWLLSSETDWGAELEGGCDAGWFGALVGDGDDEEVEEAGHGEPDGPEAVDQPPADGEEELVFAHPVADVLEGMGLVALDDPAHVSVEEGIDAERLLVAVPEVRAGGVDHAAGGGAAAADGGVAAGPATPDGGVAAGSLAVVPEDEREVAALTFRRGEGTVIVVASASPFLNEGIDWAGGGVLFDRLRAAYAPGSTVLFDEYHLGVGARRSLARYIRQLGGGPVVLQLVLVVLLLLWRAGTRFGAPRGEPEPAPAGTASYVGAIGQLYRRSKDTAPVARILAHRALGRVARHHHLPSAGAEELAKALDARGRSGEALAVREIGDLGRSDPGERGLVALARELDRSVDRATTDPEGMP